MNTMYIIIPKRSANSVSVRKIWQNSYSKCVTYSPTAGLSVNYIIIRFWPGCGNFSVAKNSDVQALLYSVLHYNICRSAIQT